MISYAQNFEDVLLQRCLGDVVQGFYVDVGANHPDVDSVTKWFYDQGWSGINIEPVPHLHRLLQEGRPRDTNLALAASAGAGRGVMQMFPASPGLSTLNSEIAGHIALEAEAVDVELRPLRDILAEVGDRPIHFLKIDVEGAERDVLLGMDFQRFRPWVLVIEAVPPDGEGPAGPAWDDLVLPFGYRFAWFDGLNRFFIAEEHLDRLPRLAQPPHVFDHFELATTRQERQRREAAEAGLVAAKGEIDRRDTRVRELDAALMASREEAAALQARSEALQANFAQATAKQARFERELAAKQAQFERELAAKQAQFERELAALQAQFEQAEAATQALQNMNAALHDEITYQREVLALMERHASTARQDVEAAHEQLQAARQETRLAQENAEAYRRSSSWRYTAPLRAARRVLSGLVDPGR